MSKESENAAAVQDSSASATPRVSLTAEEERLIQQEVWKLLKVVLVVTPLVVSVLSVLGIAGIYGAVGQMVTMTLNGKLAAVDERIDKATAEERARITDAYVEVQATSREAFKVAERFKTNSELASHQYLEDSKRKLDEVGRVAANTIDNLKSGKIDELEEKTKQVEQLIGEVERLRASLVRSLQDCDAQLAASRGKLREFEEAVNEAVRTGADGIVSSPILQDAVVGRIEPKIASRFEALSDGRSPLNTVWIMEGSPKPNSPAYSFEIAKNRFVLMGEDRLLTVATYDPIKRTFTTDAIGAVGWPDSHVEMLSPDGKRITWKSGSYIWVRK